MSRPSCAFYFAIYKFCVETPWGEKILKSDPYAFHTETRPNNASKYYYGGKTPIMDDIEYDKLPSFIRDEARDEVAGRRRVLSRER